MLILTPRHFAAYYVLATCCLSFLFRLQALWGRFCPSLCATRIKWSS